MKYQKKKKKKPTNKNKNKNQKQPKTKTKQNKTKQNKTKQNKKLIKHYPTFNFEQTVRASRFRPIVDAYNMFKNNAITQAEKLFSLFKLE